VQVEPVQVRLPRLARLLGGQRLRMRAFVSGRTATGRTPPSISFLRSVLVQDAGIRCETSKGKVVSSMPSSCRMRHSAMRRCPIQVLKCYPLSCSIGYARLSCTPSTTATYASKCARLQFRVSRIVIDARRRS
jgi:hypothetical protein